jgi:hypothetical protein
MGFVEYDDSFFCTSRLQYWAEKYIRFLPEDVTHLLSAGASGCAIASAILAKIDETRELKHIHIHPENRVSHRGENKRASGFRIDIVRGINNVYCFVDDFIASGATFRGVKEYMKDNKIHYILAAWADSHFLIHMRNSETKIIQAEQQFSPD